MRSCRRLRLLEFAQGTVRAMVTRSIDEACLKVTPAHA